MKYAAAVLLIVLLGLSGRLINFSRLADGFKGDEATYVLMTFSIANDFDMKYQSRDLVRFYNLYRDEQHPNGAGPEGIFIKKGARIVGWKWSSPFQVTAPIELIREEVPTSQSIEYGKGFAYPLFAAPFAWLGGLGGMFMFNVLLFAACVYLAAVFARARTRSLAGAVLGAVFLIASVAPVWTAWLTPELFNFALVFFAYFLWLYKEAAPVTTTAPWWQARPSDFVAAVLIGIVTFSKPNHALMIAPLGLLALSRRQLKHAILIGAFFVMGAGVFYAVDLVSTGEMNYQGSTFTGGRVTCYGRFPFDGRGSQFSDCDAKITNESNDEKIVQLGIFPTRELFSTFLRNSFYFVMGRDAGLLPFFFPGLVIIAMMLLRLRETKTWQWLTLGVVAGQAWAFLALTPWTWNGDGGPPGNRYFFSTYALMLFLLPATARWGATLLAAAGGLTFTGLMTLSPFVSAKQTWLAVRRTPFTYLPIEKTIMNALPVRLLDNERARIKWYTKTYVQFYFMDLNAYNVTENDQAKEVWMRGDSTADVVVKAGDPLTRMTFTVRSRVPNSFSFSMGSFHWSGELAPDKPQTFEFEPGPGVSSKDGYVYSMRWTCTNGFYPNKVEPGSTDERYLGVKIEPVFYDKLNPR